MWREAVRAREREGRRALRGALRTVEELWPDEYEEALLAVNEYLRKITSSCDGFSHSSKALPKIPESLQTSAFNFRNSRDVELVSEGFSSSFAGVTGILRRQEYDRTCVHALQKQAFSDLQALMSSAEEVLSVLEKYSSTIEKGMREI